MKIAIVLLALCLSSLAFADQGFRVRILSTTGFSPQEKETVERAADLFERVANSDEFKAGVVGYVCPVTGKPGFVDNQGLSNEQVFDRIMEGAEMLSPEPDHAAELSLDLYEDDGTSTVGYGNQGDSIIHMNRAFFSKMSLPEIADNLAHEWTHKLGFTHAKYYKPVLMPWTRTRPCSVPYGIGDLVERLGSRLESR